MAHAFHLDVGPDRLATLTFDLPDKKVNIFTDEVLAELEEHLRHLVTRTDIGILVLLSGKERIFIAGADVRGIAEVTDPVIATAAARRGQDLFAAWERLPFPTIAAIQGTCVGGGLELALASTYRVASDRTDLRIGLPEIRLGILPAWGGSTRLPRLIGLPAALDIILAGKSIPSKKAFKLGLVDALMPDAGFRHQVRDFALERRDRARKDDHGFDLKELVLSGNPLGRKVVFDQARKKTLEQTKGNYPAPLRALEVVRIGLEEGPAAGYAAEARAVGELATSAVSKNLVHVFQLMEGVKKPEARPAGEAREVHAAAVLGAGVMGGGIAQLIADQAEIPVRMKDIHSAALASGMEHAGEVLSKRLERRRLTEPEMKRKMALMRPTLDYSGFQSVDFVVEAVVEKMAVKQAVFAELAGQVSEETILASNTSSLSIEEIGAETPHRGRVVGMHFFNPVDKMPLVEVIAGESTSADAVATVWDFTRKLGKTPVLVKDGPGFLVNRLLMFYSLEALWLLGEGVRIEDLDRAMEEWGMPMGPFALTDEVGIDVAVKVAHILHDAFSERLPLPAWLDAFAEDPKRLGAKTSSGFYLYERRKRTRPDPMVYRILRLEPRNEDPDPAGLVDRMVLPMVNEAARCLAEGVVGSAADVDLAMILGTGFPPFRGGLCRWADQQGVSALITTLERLANSVGSRFQPSDALRETAEAGGFYARWKAGDATEDGAREGE